MPAPYSGSQLGTPALQAAARRGLPLRWRLILPVVGSIVLPAHFTDLIPPIFRMISYCIEYA
jgi:hypothetical protein